MVLWIVKEKEECNSTQNDSGGSFFLTEKEAQLGYHKLQGYPGETLLDHMVLE